MSRQPEPGTGEDPRGNRGPGYGFIAFLATLVTLALIAAYAVFLGGAQLAREQLAATADEREEVSLIEIVIDGEARLLRPETAVALVPGLSARLEERMPAVLAEMQETIDTRVDAAFAPALERVPSFTDWYYSLRGEYTRYLQALTDDLPGFMARKFTEEVIDPSGLEEDLNGLQAELNTQLAERLAAETDWALGILKTLTAQASIPADSPDHRTEVAGTVSLDQVIRDSLAVSEAEIGRAALTALAATGAGTVVATGLGTVLVKKVVGKVMGTSGMKLAVSLLGKLLLKTGVKSGGSTAAAAAGVTVCAPGGLLAIGCGVVAAGVVWLLVDKAFIEMEEAIDREAFEAEIRAAMIEERDGLKARLAASYESAIRKQYAEFARQLVTRTPGVLRSGVERGFVPADAVGGD